MLLIDGRHRFCGPSAVLHVSGRKQGEEGRRERELSGAASNMWSPAPSIMLSVQLLSKSTLQEPDTPRRQEGAAACRVLAGAVQPLAREGYFA